MPFRFEARPRNMGTGLACRAVKAAELQDDDLAEALLRALRFGYFATLADDGHRGRRSRPQAATVPGLDVDRLLADLDDRDAVEQAYQADRAESRNADATGRPMILQDKHADTDGANRYTAPSARVRARRAAARGRRLAVVRGLRRDGRQPRAGARAPRDARARGAACPAFPYGLTTQEVAVACTANLRETDREGTLRKLVVLAFEGKARRVDVGDDALWIPGLIDLPNGVRAADRLADGARAPHGDHDHGQRRGHQHRRPGQRRSRCPCASSWRAVTASADALRGAAGGGEDRHQDAEAERAAELVGDVDEARGGAGVALGDARAARPRSAA